MSSADSNQSVRAVLYTRVSSKEQEKGFSLEAQGGFLEKYAEEKGISVVRKFTDVETAKAAGRTSFTQMVAYLKQNPSIKILLVEKTDRLYRNFRDYVDLEELNLSVHLVKEHEILTNKSSSHTMLFHEIKVAMARHYLRNLSEEVIKGMDKKAEKGEWPCRVPIGYVRDTHDHKIYPDPERAPLIRRLFEDYDTGRYTLTDIVDRAAQIGLRTKKNNAIGKSGIHRILTNLIYTGIFIYKGKLQEGTHEIIVPPDLYQRVKRRLNGGYGGTWTAHSRPFRGLVKCGKCGCSMTPDTKKGKYVYYRCTEYKGKCKNAISEQKLADLLGEVVLRVKIPADAAEGLKTALEESHAEKKQFHKEAMKKLQDQYQKVKNRLDNAYLDKVDGRIDEKFWRKKADDWNAELVEIEAMITSHRKANQTYLETGSQIIELARQAYDLFLQQDNWERRKLIDTLVSQSTFADGKLDVVYRKPFDLFVKIPEIKIWRG